jgi:hypothetical protein
MVPDRDLNSEVCSTRLEAEPKEPESDLTNPLASEPLIENEPVSDLNHEPCSWKVDDEPSEAPNGFTKLLA